MKNNKFLYRSFPLKGVLLTKALISQTLNTFFNDYFTGKNASKHLQMIVIIQYADLSYKSLILI